MKKEERESTSTTNKLKPPTSLKRQLPAIDDVSKIAKTDSIAAVKPNLSTLRNETFTVPNKRPVKPIEKPTLRSSTVKMGSVSTTFTKASSVRPARPTWDLRGKMAELEAACNERIANADKKIEELEEERGKLSDEIKVCSETISELETQKNNLNSKNQELSENIQQLSAKIDSLKKEFDQSLNANSNLRAENEQLEKYKQELQTDIESKNHKIKNLETEISENKIGFLNLQAKYETLLSEIAKYKQQIDSLNAEIVQRNKEFEEVNKKYYDLQKQTFDLNLELDLKKSNLESLTIHYETALRKSEQESRNNEKINSQYELLKSEKENLFENFNKDEKQIIELTNELNALRSKTNRDSQTITSFQNQINELTNSRDRLQNNLSSTGSEVEFLRKELSLYKKQLGQADIDRRVMHHKFMELRGTIRVCCRVRPLLSSEHQSYIIDINSFECTLSVQSTISRENVIGNKAESNKYDFAFDQIFNQNSTQSEVFNEIDPLIQSALDGYSVSIFAYGQTGSGKTFTMEGDLTDPDKVGLIQRSVAKIFDLMQTFSSKGWEYKVEVSFLEIYNETLRDLLVKDSQKLMNKLDIKTITSESKKGNEADVSIPDLTTLVVTNIQEVKKLLVTANKNRSVAATKCNEQSSRSHSVFRLRLTGTNACLNDSTEATINLVDLAGSERLSQSCAENDRLKETQHINKSLSTLKTVITSLYNKENHVPFRDSKLTRLLQSSLGGNCKTLMIVNISPNEESYNESLNSLRFASTVNKCYIGTATKKKASQ